jgi:VanZ family protein
MLGRITLSALLLLAITGCSAVPSGEISSVAWTDDGAVYAVRLHDGVRELVHDGTALSLECEPSAVASAGAGHLAVSVACGADGHGILDLDPRTGAADWLVRPGKTALRNVSWSHAETSSYASTVGCSRIVRFSGGGEVPIPAVMTVDDLTWRPDRNVDVDDDSSWPTCVGFADWPVVSRDGGALFLIARVTATDPASLVRFAQPVGGSTVLATGFDVVYGLAVSPDATSAVVTGQRGERRSAWLVDAATGALTDLRLAYPGAVAFSPDGRSIGVWTTARGWTVIDLPGEEGIGRWIPILVVSAALLPLVAVGAVVVARRRIRAGRSRSQAWVRTIAEFGMVAGTLPWLAMILTPVPRMSGVNLMPMVDLLQVLHAPALTAFYQVGGNLLVFAAFGFFAPWRWRLTAGQVMVFAALASVLVETLQYVLNLGRYSSIDDVLVNAAGAFVAAVVSRVVAGRFWVATRKPRRLPTADELDWTA